MTFKVLLEMYDFFGKQVDRANTKMSELASKYKGGYDPLNPFPTSGNTELTELDSLQRKCKEFMTAIEEMELR